MVTTPEVIAHFAVRELVPIEVEEVANELATRGVKDEIYVWEVKVDSRHLRGKLVHWEPWDYPEGPGDAAAQVCIADIYVSEELDVNWRRLVVCKELLHVIDPEICRVADNADVKRLIERIILPSDLQDPMEDGHKVWTDRFATYEALAVLFPWATRDLLLPKFKEGKLSIADIAQLVGLPNRYVTMVMSEIWAEAYPFLIAEIEEEA